MRSTVGIATITLHRPERMNAWTGRMHTEYRHCLRSRGARRDGACDRRNRCRSRFLRRRRCRGAAGSREERRLRSGHAGNARATRIRNSSGVRRELCVPFRLVETGDRCDQRTGRRRWSSARVFRRPAFCGSRNQDDDGARQAQPSGRIRTFVAVAENDRADTRERIVADEPTVPFRRSVWRSDC